MGNINNPADQPPDDRSSEFKAGLTLDQQRDLVRGIQTPEGLKEFGDALVNGSLKALLPLDLPQKAALLECADKKIQSSTVSLRYGTEIYRTPSSTPEKHALVQGIGVTTNPGSRELEFRLDCHNIPLGTVDKGPKGNGGLRMDLDYRFVNNLLVFKGGLIHMQTVADPFDEKPKPFGGLNAVCVVNADGVIVDILDPFDYVIERDFGFEIRGGNILRRAGRLDAEQTKSLDLFEQIAEGAKLSHHRDETTYKQLRDDAAIVLARPLDKILFAEINPLKTFEAIMNQPVNIKSAPGGGGMVSVPPIVFN